MTQQAMVHFVGAGPGAPDLITLRGASFLRSADVVIFAGSLVNPELLSLAPQGCEIYDSSRMTLEQVLGVMEEATAADKDVVRLHTGDPCLYGAIREQMDLLERKGIAYDDTPGVSSLCAAAASLGAEYTLPGVSQSVVVTRLAGRTPVPEAERLSALATHGSSMVIFLSAGMLSEVREELLRGGYERDTPAAIVYKASWPEERVVRTTVGELAEDGEKACISKTALILVGHFLAARGERSRLYDPAFSTGLREAAVLTDGTDTKRKAVRKVPFLRTAPAACTQIRNYLSRYAPTLFRNCVQPRPDVRNRGTFQTVWGRAKEGATLFGPRPACQGVALISFSERGQTLAERLARELGGSAQRCEPGGLTRWTSDAFARHEALVFVGATGIAVRAIAPHAQSKACDPAVVVVDEQGRFAIPILSGHLGGANDLARRIGKICGAQAVITTATDGRGVFAVDEWARYQGYVVTNPARIRRVSAALLAGDTIRVCSDWPLPPQTPPNVVTTDSRDACDVLLSARSCDDDVPLHLVPRVLTLGVGCRRGVSGDALLERYHAFMERAGYDERALVRMCSIDAKANEQGLIDLCEALGVPFETFSAQELAAAPGSFASSAFVHDAVGVDNVCERSAVLGSDGGALVCAKDAADGITMALACSPFQPTWRYSHE